MQKKMKRRIKIRGTGFYVPDKILTNFDLEKMVDTSDEWIITRTGIKERRVASEDQATSDLAVEASRRALENAGLEVKDIDLIIVATSTPDTIFPSTACWVQKGLGADYIPAFDISVGCTGFLYGMILAEGLILNGTSKRILLIGGELLTKVTNWKDRNTCVLFGDAAAATVLEEADDESGMLSYYWTGRRLKVPPEKVYSNIHKYGNVSVASIPIGLHELWEEGKLKKGNIILMDAFGAGFTWAAVAYRW